MPLNGQWSRKHGCAPVQRNNRSGPCCDTGARHLQEPWADAEGRACHAIGVRRASHRSGFRRDPGLGLRPRLTNLAASRLRFGVCRGQVLLHHEGGDADHTRDRRLCSKGRLSIRTRTPPGGVPAAPFPAGQGPTPSRTSGRWTSYQAGLLDGRASRILSGMNGHMREAPATSARTNVRAHQVIGAPGRIAWRRGKPRTFRVDPGPNSPVGCWTDGLAGPRGRGSAVSRPEATRNIAVMEARSRRLRQGCPNTAWFCARPMLGKASGLRGSIMPAARRAGARDCDAERPRGFHATSSQARLHPCRNPGGDPARAKISRLVAHVSAGTRSLSGAGPTRRKPP